MNGESPIDPNGCTVDIARTCFRTRMRPWKDDATEVRVRWSRGTPGAPDLHFPHLFGLDFLWDDRLQLDPEPGQVGTLYTPRQYDKGRRPAIYAPNGTYVGSERQWAEGSTRGMDPVLHPTSSGPTLECLAQLGIALSGRPEPAQILDGS